MNVALAAVLARLARDPGLGAFMRDEAAVMLIASDGGHVLHGNEAGLAMGKAGFSSKTILQFARLAGGLAPGNGVRLEQIALPTPRGTEALTCACRRIRTEDGTIVLLIAAQVHATPDRQMPAPVQVPLPVQMPSSASLPETTTPEIKTFEQGSVVPVSLPLPGKLRFIWEMDDKGLNVPQRDDITTVFGRDTVDAIAGQPWSALCGRVVDDPGNGVASAFAAGKTFSGLGTYWRRSGTDDACKVTLSGLPLVEGTGAKTRWRGFGIIDTRQSVPFAPAQVMAEAGKADQMQPDDAMQPDDGIPELYPAQRAMVPPQAGTQHDLHQPPGAVNHEAAPTQTGSTNVVQIRPHDPALRLTSSERNAFREIAKALGARLEGDEAASQPTGADEAAHLQESAGSDDVTGPDQVADAEAGFSSASLPASLPEAVSSPVAQIAPDGLVASIPALPPALERVVQLVPPLLPAPPREDMFMALLDKLPIGILVLKAERIAYANRTLLDLLDHDSVDDLLDVGTDRLFRGSVPSEGGGVFTLTRRDGSFEPVDARLSAITWNGQPATLMSFRRALETGDAARADALGLDLDKAQAQARELVAILDTATDGVATVDDRGRILSLNKSAEALFGYDQREVTGENFTLLLAPESHITALDYLEGLKGGGVASLLNDGREVSGRVRQGGRIPLFMTMGRVADGPDKKYSAVLRDMTAWKRAEADLVEAKRQAERASAQKSDVLAKISHEIRTPLNAILGFTEVMSEERFGPIGNERYKEYLGDIHQSGGYLISLINDLLDLAKIEAGKMDLTFVGVNLNDIATSSVALLQPEANRQRVVLRTGLQPKLPAVVADDRSLRQIVINVLSNAVKFTDAGGQVIVSTALGDRGEVILRVRDTGVGMSEKELALAMEPFRQVSATRRGNGTGLGLPITKALVEANKGALLITSAKNEGTLVEITFPPQRVLAS